MLMGIGSDIAAPGYGGHVADLQGLKVQTRTMLHGMMTMEIQMIVT